MDKIDNRLILRQIRRHLKEYDSLPQNVKDFILSVQKSYSHYENDRKMLDRVMELNSKELEALLEKSHEETRKQNVILNELTSIIVELQDPNSNPKKMSSKADVTELTSVLRNEVEKKIKIQQELIQHDLEIKKALKEKEVLLKEIHHRVKNNMQVVTSLLSLQSRRIKPDDESKKLFDLSVNRIKSMSLIHEMLYESNNLNEINYQDYVERLVKTLIISTKGSGHQINSEINIGNIQFGMDTAIPLGLIINEIVTNSLKYGIDSAGDIYITITPKSENQFEMNIGDYGSGNSRNIDFKNTETLGIQLVSYLSEQLEGTIRTIEKEKGIHYKLNFQDI